MSFSQTCADDRSTCIAYCVPQRILSCAQKIFQTGKDVLWTIAIVILVYDVLAKQGTHFSLMTVPVLPLDFSSLSKRVK